MAQNITLNVSKNVIRDGECVDVSWESNVPESIFLTIEDGYGTTRIDIPDSGSRKCWSNHAKKNLVITLTAIQAGKKEVITKKVRIKGSSSGNAGISKFRLWRERQQAKRAVAKAEYHYAWTSMKKWKKILWISLMALAIVMFVLGITNGCTSGPELPGGSTEITSI